MGLRWVSSGFQVGFRWVGFRLALAQVGFRLALGGFQVGFRLVSETREARKDAIMNINCGALDYHACPCPSIQLPFHRSLVSSFPATCPPSPTLFCPILFAALPSRPSRLLLSTLQLA